MALATANLNTKEYVDDTINNLYTTYLHRPADPVTDVPVWEGALIAGTFTEQQIETFLLGSAEYFNGVGGGNNATWINQVFMDVLGRSANATEQSNFLAALNSLNAN